MVKSSNKRRVNRIRIDRSVKIPVHLYPILPFIGKPIQAGLINISEGGMAFQIDREDHHKKLIKGSKFEIHFRFGNRPLKHCHGILRHAFQQEENLLLGIRFFNLPVSLRKDIQNMKKDNQLCEDRLEIGEPWCQEFCTFYALCRKSIRIETSSHLKKELFEITFQLLPGPSAVV